ncbi:MAG: TylF/MycF/NovP-related O-methyltransferase [Candidatus Saccharibacteria bacterium]|nr:TylF/MycF/NovP-related O-methyltransferase [Candidatus Saccharibacteria bacterium]
MEQVSKKETEIILAEAEKCLVVPGDIVELGCYRGDTSLLLGRMLADAEKAEKISECEKRLWIYDSFQGLPEKTAEDASVAGDEFQKGELMVTKNFVVTRFKKAGLRVPITKKAFFQELCAADLPEKIAFAFLDGDLYESIKVSLRLIEEKILGTIIVHDYNNEKLPGVARAVNQWRQKNPEWKKEIRETMLIMRRD